MRATKTIAVVGADEETVAHLRLLMRMGQNQLRAHWRWGREDAADFVAVERSDLGCEGVISRCQSAGVPCAVLAAEDDAVVHGLVLRRPLKLDQIVAVLNAASAESANSGEIEAFAEDFWLRDLEDFDPPKSDASESSDVWARQERPQATQHVRELDADTAPAPTLDLLIHGDPLVEPEPPRRLIQPDTTFELSRGEPTRRSLSRADESRHRVMPDGVVGVGPVDVRPIVLPPRNDGSMPLSGEGLRYESNEPQGRRLRELLDGELMQSPSQLQLEGLPTLTLDPKTRTAHAADDLSALERWWQVGILPSAMHTVTSIELTRVRESQHAFSYTELFWLEALLGSGGRLASRLDPGGSFEVVTPVRIDPAYRAHGAIARALTQPVRLHEIAAASRASMMQVYDVVNAYDAIGRLRCTPRERFATPPPVDARSGLSKLRWPFGKR